MLKAFATNLKPDTFSEFLTANGFSVMTGTMMFMNYHESMIKTAARTVILRIFSRNPYVVKPENIKEYVIKSGFFNCFVSMLSDKLTLCDRYIFSLNSSKLEASLSEILEDLYYINDILELQIAEFCEILTSLFLKTLIYPIAIGSLGSVQHSSYHISIPLSATFLHQTLQIIRHADLVNSLVMGLLLSPVHPDLVQWLHESPSPSLAPKLDLVYLVSLTLDSLEGFEKLENLCANPVPDIVFSFLTSRDNNLVGVILMLLNSVISSASVNNNLLLATGLISYTKVRMKSLLNSILEENKGSMGYNENTVEILLKMIAYEEPLRVFHFRLACSVVVSLAYRSDIAVCLKDSHQSILNAGIKRCIAALREFLADNSDYDGFFEAFEEEWRNIGLASPRVQFPLNLLLAYVDDISGIPLEQRDPADDNEAIVCEIRRFLLLWGVKLKVGRDKTVFLLDVYPLYYMNDACCWEKGKRYQMENKNCVKCSVKFNKHEEYLHYANDPDFFLLVHPENKLSDYVDVKFVESLLNIEVLPDRSDPRRLVIMVKNQSTNLDLVFSDPQRCLWALKEINNSKQACRDRYVILLNKLFSQLEGCN